MQRNGPFDFFLKAVFLLLLAPLFVGFALQLLAALAVSVLPLFIVFALVAGVSAGLGFAISARHRTFVTRPGFRRFPAEPPYFPYPPRRRGERDRR